MSTPPPYQVPTMHDITTRPWNGHTVVSTFSGCGGSALGYRMAGFRVLWSSEFVEAAQDTYRANQPPHTTLDTRDIRTVTAHDIREATHLDVGELDLLDGSPPCASFSVSGKRHHGWGETNRYSDVEQRTDDLFYEYARLLNELQPKTFVAENVSGLVKGPAKGYFKRILTHLRQCGYHVDVRKLDASWLGVPQKRQRLFFLGVRTDLAMAPVFPKPVRHQYTVADAIPTTLGLTHDPETGARLDFTGYAIERFWRMATPGEKVDARYNLTRVDPHRPCPTITANGGDPGTPSVTHWAEPRKFTLGELRQLSGFPTDFTLTGNHERRWERLGRAVPPIMMSHIATTLRDTTLTPHHP